MGLLIEGRRHDQWYNIKNSKGEFVCSESICGTGSGSHGLLSPGGQAEA